VASSGAFLNAANPNLPTKVVADLADGLPGLALIGLPDIGETSPRQFVATGFSGNGMTFGTLAAMMARDAALGRSNPWRELFDVHRKTLRGGTWDYIHDINTAKGSRDGLRALGMTLMFEDRNEASEAAFTDALECTPLLAVVELVSRRNSCSASGNGSGRLRLSYGLLCIAPSSR